MPKTLTKVQILDYLIYHIPLQESTKGDFDLAHENGFIEYNPKTLPFKVEWDMQEVNVHFISTASTPWKCYADLAKMIWEDFRANKIIAKLYYNG